MRACPPALTRTLDDGTATISLQPKTPFPENNAVAELRDALAREAAAQGFAALGIASAAGDPARRMQLTRWLSDGHHATMDWMATRSAERSDPQRLWAEARSIIALGMSYAPAQDPRLLEAHPNRGRISVYAQGRDYHDTVKKALKRLARWLCAEADRCGLGDIGVKVFVDTAPVMEKPLGEAAGLGWQGKHSNIVNREHGNWLFLGSIYTTLEMPVDQPHPHHCGSCTRCLAACPTDAFPTPGVVDARRCISYLTIEHKGPIPDEFRSAMGNRIYGCDDCLAACPWNRFAEAAAANRAFLPRAELVAPRLADLLALDDTGFRKLFSGSPIKRIGRDRFIRNCAIAAGNSHDRTLLRQLRNLAQDRSAVVAEAAQWAIGQISRTC